MAGKHILIVEDEQAIAQAVHDGLQDEGYTSTIAATAEDAQKLPIDQFALVLLDIRLPGMDGYELCRWLRSEGHTLPIIFVSARDDVTDRIIGLELGADDYIVKPFSFKELLSRIKAQMRRSYGEFSTDSEARRIQRFGAITVDRRSMRVFRDGKDVYLTPIEYRLLQLFLEYPGQVLNRDQIIDHVWGNTWVIDDPKSVNVHMRHLREKIEDDPAHPSYLVTVRGYGYRFDLPA
jgi:DNA-binding response OmpR family regulator